MKRMKFFFAFFLIIVTQKPVVFGQTLLLTGSPQYVQIGDLDITGNQITVEALVKYTGGVNIVSKHTSPADVNYLMRIGTFEISTTQQFYLMSNPYAGSMQTNTWYHVAGTYDGSFIRYYVNGCLIVEQAATGNLLVNNLMTGIGNQSSCQCEQFNGEIDELRIWSAARTPAELTANMFDLPSPTAQANLKAYYKFDNNLTNLQGNAAFDGTWIGTPAYGTQPASSVIPAMAIQSVVASDATCFGLSTGLIEITASGSNLSYSLDGTTWQTTSQLGPLPAGNYTAYVRSQEGCVLTSTGVTINQPVALTVQTSVMPTTTCSGAPNGSIVATPAGGTGPYTYSWSPSGGTGSTASGLAAGTYTVQVHDQHLCEVSASATVTGGSALQLVLANSTNVTCSGAANGTALLQASGGTTPYAYSWDPASVGTIANPTTLSPGSYTGTVTDAGGCTSSVSFTITQPSAIVVSEVFTSPTCGETNGEITLTVTGGSGTYNYLWSPSVSASAIASNLGAGSYSVTVTDGNGCSVPETYGLTATGDFGLTATPPIASFHAGDSIQLTAATVLTNNVTISWAPSLNLTCTNCTDPVAVPDGDEIYTVYATTPDGCIDSAQVIVKIIIPCTEIFIPTIFSPNGDGNNDMLQVRGNCIKNIDLIIYDRWGEKVFESQSVSDQWDGYFKNEPANTGAYIYKLDLVLLDGSRYKTSGNITLTR